MHARVKFSRGIVRLRARARTESKLFHTFASEREINAESARREIRSADYIKATRTRLDIEICMDIALSPQGISPFMEKILQFYESFLIKNPKREREKESLLGKLLNELLINREHLKFLSPLK